jgi:hypothetical protein
MTEFYRYHYPIEKAIVAYRVYTKRIPQEMIVNPRLLSTAQKAVQSLGLLPGLIITTSGGCLLGEVWLNIPTNDQSKNGQLSLPLEAK